MHHVVAMYDGNEMRKLFWLLLWLSTEAAQVIPFERLWP